MMANAFSRSTAAMRLASISWFGDRARRSAMRRAGSVDHSCRTRTADAARAPQTPARCHTWTSAAAMAVTGPSSDASAWAPSAVHAAAPAVARNGRVGYYLFTARGAQAAHRKESTGAAARARSRSASTPLPRASPPAQSSLHRKLSRAAPPPHSRRRVHASPAASETFSESLVEPSATVKPSRSSPPGYIASCRMWRRDNSVSWTQARGANSPLLRA